MNRDRIFDELEHVLDLAARAVANAPAPVGNPNLAVDVRDLVRALHFELRRYRDALTNVIIDSGS